MMTYYYAEESGHAVTADIYVGGLLMHEAYSQPYTDLFRFNTKKERDTFVANNQDARVITYADARKEHKDQFAYWSYSTKI